MTKDVFIKIVDELVLPLFTGSYIDGEDVSSTRDNEVAQGVKGTMLVKPKKEDEYRIVIKRSQPFKSGDIELMQAIIEELSIIGDFNIDDQIYIQRLHTFAIEKAICKSLTETASETVLGVISELDTYARRTYEGQRIKFGIMINEFNVCQNKNSNLYYKNMFKKDFLSVISNGVQSCIELDKEGFILGHVLFEKLRYYPTIAPYEYTGVARYANDKRIGIVLLESGEIMLYKNHELMYCKKRGVWCCYFHDEIIQLLSNKTNHTIKEIRKAIYFTALDCSFVNAGGCIVYLNKFEIEDALKHIDINDIVSEKYFELKKKQMIEEDRTFFNYNEDKQINENITFQENIINNNLAKSASLNQCIQNLKFHELNRKFREEIVAIDGATIIDHDGSVVATGAIIKIGAGSTGGGRLAAAKTLAKYGVSIKISADGMMQAFIKDRKLGVRPIFNVG